MNLEHLQQALRAEGLDGWLFYDFRRSNPVAHRVLSLPDDEMYTRRWFYFVPTEGTPGALVSAVESHVLRSLPGERHIFQTWQNASSPNSATSRWRAIARPAGVSSQRKIPSSLPWPVTCALVQPSTNTACSSDSLPSWSRPG